MKREKGTYINDICLEHMLYPMWNGLPVVPTRAAIRELDRLHLDVADAAEILEEGYDCARSRRAKGVFERCARRGGKTLKVVVAKSVNRFLATDCWAITHVGAFK